MKSFVILCTCILSLTLPSFGQTKTKSLPKKIPIAPCVQPVAPVQNLKDDFAKSSLRVLKMIEGEDGEYRMGQDGGLLVPRLTSAAINDLDVDAQTKEDQAVVSVMRVFFMAHLDHNVAVSTLSSMAETALIGTNLPQGPLQVSKIISRSPTVAKINSTELACSSGLETVLRARNYQDVAACSKEALEVPAPAALDVSVEM